MPCLRFLFLPLLAALAGGASGAEWRQEVYVWQRQWTPAVNAALEAIDAATDTVHILAAEMNWRNGRGKIFRAEPDYAALKKLRARVGLVLRIGPYTESFSTEDAVAAQLASVVAERLREAREAGLEPVELQVDFDCAESKLAGYREWLRALRASTGSVRLVFTALPAWLRHPEAFAALAGEADGFVLQVHSLEKPADVNASLVLCDPVRTRKWAEQASRVGRPFRIALPTYGYEVAFDASGRFFQLAAEEPRRSLKAGTQLRVVRADEIEMAELARELREKPPAGCEGVIWFRLPVEGDRLNWSVRTLSAILRGGPLRAQLKADCVSSADDRSLAEVVIENTGDLTQPLPARVEVTWRAGVGTTSADALAGYALTLKPGDSRATFSLAPALVREPLAPGRRVRVGWLRFSHETSLHIERLPSTTPP